MNSNYRRMLSLLLALMLLPAVFLTARAEDYWASLESLHFDITLQEDGSALITETREVRFYGDHEFTRYGVTNGFTGPREFSDWEVSMDGEIFTMLEAPDNDGRPDNTFAVEEGDTENTVYIYHRSNSVTRLFQISYRVKNAVKLYSDVGEFHWNLTGESGISAISYLSATLIIPEGVSQEDFRIWAHGPLNGTFEKLDSASAYLSVENVPYGTVVDLRSTIPADFFHGGWEQEGEILADILAEEKALADSANAKREEEARKEAQWQAEQDAYWAEREVWQEEHPVLTEIESFCSGIVWFIEDVIYYIEDTFVVWLALAGLAVFFLSRLIAKLLNLGKKSRHTPVHSPQYYRQLPDCRPAPNADRLLNIYKKGGTNVSRHISASLLELNLTKKLRFHTGYSDTEILLSQPVWTNPASNYQQPINRTVRVIRNTDGSGTVFDSHGSSSPAGERNHLDILLQFLQEAAGPSGRITVSELKRYVRDNAGAAGNFRRDFENAEKKAFWERVTLEQPAKPRLRENRALLIAPAAAAVLMLLISVGSSIYDGVYWVGSLIFSLGAAALVLLMGVLIHLGRNSALSGKSYLDQKSENDLALWEAFGRFLDDFTTFDRKELPEFPVWREYMVYAVAIGKGQKVAKALAVKYPDAVSAGTSGFDDEYYRMLQEMALYDTLDSIGEEVMAAAPVRSSSGSDSWGDSWSDSSGGGGGFSDSGGGSDSGSRGDFAD